MVRPNGPMLLACVLLYLTGVSVYTYCVGTVYRQLDTDIKEDFLLRIGGMFGLERADVNQLYNLLMECMDYRQSVSNVTVGRLPTHGLKCTFN